MFSMTGYGRSQCRQDGHSVAVEVKSVNHRFLDVSLRLPQGMLFLENALKDGVGKVLRRGHVDVMVTYKPENGQGAVCEVDVPLAQSYVRAAQTVARLMGKINNLSVKDLMALEGVTRLEKAGVEEEAVAALALQALNEALCQLRAMRQKEGEQTKGQFMRDLGEIAVLLRQLAAYQDDIPQKARQRLQKRLEEMQAAGVDEARFMQEVAYLVDRASIDEEISRLHSHAAQFDKALTLQEPVGRKLDFILQEMNREANTICSKSQDADLTRAAVELKCIFEKMREQVQNIE